MSLRLYNKFTVNYLRYKFNKLFYKNSSDNNLSKVYQELHKKYGKIGSNLAYIDESTLNLNHYDNIINQIIMEKAEKNKIDHLDKPEIKKIAILYTEIHPTGGHTPLIERIAESFKDEYQLKLFTSRLNYSKYGDYSKKKLNNITKIFDIDGVTSYWNDPILERYVFKLHEKISYYNPKIIFCYHHPFDVVLAGTLALIKRFSKSKVIFINIQDHFYNLGFKFADLIIDARPAGQKITKKIRFYKNTTLMPLQQRKKEDTKYLLKGEILRVRNSLGINNNQYFTLSGGASYKYFDENDSLYFRLIKNLLESQEKLVHVIISNIEKKFEKIIHHIFQNNISLLERLKIIELKLDYDPYMQSCDLFIDSFPQGAALTHIDMMRNKKPTIIKINKENPTRSFEFYLPKDYPYAYDNLTDMQKGILELLDNKNARNSIANKLYQYYLDHYEFNVIKDKYKKIVDNTHNLQQFYGTSFY